MINIQFAVAWVNTPNSCGSETRYGPFSRIRSWRSHTQLHRGSNGSQLSEHSGRDYWQEQGRHALSLHHAVFERAAHEYEQSGRDEVHVAVARQTEMTERMCTLGNQAEHTRISHQVTLFNEVNGVAGDALENQRRSLFSEATAEASNAKITSMCQYLQGVRRFVRSATRSPSPTGCE